MALINTTTTGVLGSTFFGDGSGDLTIQQNGVTVNKITSQPAFSAYASAGTSLSNATFTKINYATEDFDTNNNFASSRFTPTVAGYYQISAVTRLGSITASIVAFNLYKNGAGGTAGGGSGVAAGYVYPIISTLVYLNGTTDYVEIYCYQNSGGSTTTDSGTDYKFTGVLARAA